MATLLIAYLIASLTACCTVLGLGLLRAYRHGAFRTERASLARRTA